MTTSQISQSLIPVMRNRSPGGEAAQPRSRKQVWAGCRFGFVGSRATYDHLRFEVETIVPSPDAAEALIAAGLLDALILEAAPDEVSNHWGMAFLDFGSRQDNALALMEMAARHGLPRIAYLNGPAARVPLFLPLAQAADHVVVTSRSAQMALQAAGVAAVLAPMPVQTALFHGFGVGAKTGDDPASAVLSLDLQRASTDPDLAGFLRSLLPFGVALYGMGQGYLPRTDTLGPIAGCAGGNLTMAQLQTVLETHDILVQVAHPDRDDGMDRQLALNAAAARCVVVVLGAVAPDDPRNEIAHIFDDSARMRAFISRLLMQPIWAEKIRQQTWRRAHHDHGAHRLVQSICDMIGIDTPRPWPKASVVAPVCHPERLADIVRNFRAQSWSDRELIVIANTDTPDAWDTALLDAEDGEQIVFLSRGHAPDMAIKLGVQRARGDYIMRMEGGVAYGPAHVEDMMLAAFALRPDIMTKSSMIYDFGGNEGFFSRSVGLPRPVMHDDMAADTPIDGLVTGPAPIMRRAIARQMLFPTYVKPTIDQGLQGVGREARNLLCADAGALNLVIECRDDPENPLENGVVPDRTTDDLHQMTMTMGEFLAPDYPSAADSGETVPAYSYDDAGVAKN